MRLDRRINRDRVGQGLTAHAGHEVARRLHRHAVAGVFRCRPDVREDQAVRECQQWVVGGHRLRVGDVEAGAEEVSGAEGLGQRRPGRRPGRGSC